MEYTEAVFSPTGGTKRVLRALTASWGNPRRTIDLCARDADLATVSFDPRDVVVFAVPSYGGRVPRAVAERMAALKGNGAACVLLCVYGNRAFDDTLAEMEDIAVAAGFRPAAAVAAIAEHSIVRRFAAGRPDAQDADELEAMGRRIRERVEEPGTEKPVVPGDRPYRQPGSVPFVPKASKGCVQCGTCAEGCPVGAIDPANPARTDKDACITCMRCVAVCPSHVRNINGAAAAMVSAKLSKVCADRKPNELFL